MANSSFLNEYKTLNKLDEPWPENATIYEPYESEQILLAEHASGLGVKVYLRMCNLAYKENSCTNAEFMSPGGRLTKLPVLQVGAFVLAEFEPIASFIEQKGYGIDNTLGDYDRFEMRTYLTMAENIFTMAELYVYFRIDQVYNSVTSERIRWAYPWPLSLIRCYRKRQQAISLLKVYQWNDKCIDNVIEDVRKCCEMLEMALARSGGPFFYGENPCALDAVVFGHIFTILTVKLPNMGLAQSIRFFPLLLDFCQHMEYTYFSDKSVESANKSS